MQCGLLGRKLSHSYSPQIHNALTEYSYHLFEVEPEGLDDFFQNTPFTGINVTIPYKKAVIPYCTELSDCAQKLGAVNTIIHRADGSLIGHNTDYFGFQSMLQNSGLSVEGKKALVLGSGGASATVVAVLAECGAFPVVISRSGENNYDNLHIHTDASVIVNATPVGTFPDVDNSPVDLEAFPKLEGVLDLIYNPARTKLLLQAEQMGLIAENGLWMLVAQAKESAEWFSGHTIDDTQIARIYHMLHQQMENLTLVGMPGCGKSTIGRILAEKLQKTFVDADSEIVNTAGISIPQIFETSGEVGFREIEMQVLEQLGKRSGLVIATGGGCVTRKENYNHLHQNGTIVWLKRDLDQLATEGRPLSKTGELDKMYAVRKPLYERFADFTVENDLDPNAVADKIISALNLEV